MHTDPAGPDSVFAQRRIIVGVSGGIAAYKLAHLVSRLAQAGAEVTTAMTEAATRFIAPLTFASLSGRPVITSMWENADADAHDPQHIRLARSTDAMIIAPATMDLLARLANGFSGDSVTLLASAIDPVQTPILIAPSMNATMLAQRSTQRNLAQLEEDGFIIIEPADGWQACRTVGPGRMPEPEALLQALAGALSSRPSRR